MNISGSGKTRRWAKKIIKQDFQNYRWDGSKIETTDKSYWLETGEKIWFEPKTGEIKID